MHHQPNGHYSSLHIPHPRNARKATSPQAPRSPAARWMPAVGSLTLPAFIAPLRLCALVLQAQELSIVLHQGCRWHRVTEEKLAAGRFRGWEEGQQRRWSPEGRQQQRGARVGPPPDRGRVRNPELWPVGRLWWRRLLPGPRGLRPVPGGGCHWLEGTTLWTVENRPVCHSGCQVQLHLE